MIKAGNAVSDLVAALPLIHWLTWAENRVESSHIQCEQDSVLILFGSCCSRLLNCVIVFLILNFPSSPPINPGTSNCPGSSLWRKNSSSHLIFSNCISCAGITLTPRRVSPESRVRFAVFSCQNNVHMNVGPRFSTRTSPRALHCLHHLVIIT